MKILELNLLTQDIIQTENFYGNTLGLQTISKTSSSISFSVGYSTLIFIQTNNTRPFYHFAFDIPNNKITEAFTWLNSKADIIPVTGTEKIANSVPWNAQSIYFHDSSGNILEFIARLDLENSTAKTFDSSTILSISEIGLPDNNLITLSEQLVANHKLTYFSKQPKRNDFTVIGDEYGLLIFVTIGRNWFPTNKPAERHWANVKINTNNDIIDFTFGE